MPSEGNSCTEYGPLWCVVCTFILVKCFLIVRRRLFDPGSYELIKKIIVVLKIQSPLVKQCKFT